jgi:hypothetical protein
MTGSLPRRRLLGLVAAALAGCLSNPRERSGPTDFGGDPTPTPGTPTPTNEPGCGTPIARRWNVRDRDPSIPACPEKPDPLEPCSARAFAIGLEQHARYTHALDGEERVLVISFSATPQSSVTRVELGYVVFARLYFDAETATETGERTGTPTATDVGTAAATDVGTPTGGETTTEGTTPRYGATGPYNVHYLVTGEGQWRAAGHEPGAIGTADTLRRAGVPVDCG